MKAIRPKGILTQGYNDNYNAYYKANGMIAHGAEDYVNYHRAPIEATVTGLVYSIRPPKKFDVYTAVYILAKDDKGYYEYSYGHLFPDPKIKEGDYISQGTVIGYQSNYGICYTNGILVTNKEKEAGSGKGSHLHYQKREVEASKQKGKHYLQNSKGALKIDGLYFNVKNYDNGFQGCVDPKYDYEFEFKNILRYGMRNNADVVELQKRLGVPQTGFYLDLTRQAVEKFQRENKVASEWELNLVRGRICGKKTLSVLNK